MKIINEQYAANAIFRSVLRDEKAWRKDKANKHDIAVADEMLRKIRGIGFKYHYLADITNRDNTDSELCRIVTNYIGCFDDDGISAELVGVIGKKGNTFATETILNNYFSSSEDNQKNNAIFYDNALYRIKDKRYLSSYLEMLKKPEIAVRFHLTMVLLGKWNVKEAKDYFFEYLDSNIFYLNTNVSDLVFTSIEALSYYDDPEGIILKALEKKANCGDKDVLRVTQKAIKRLTKNK